MTDVKRYRVSYMNGIIEEDGSPRSPHDSEPMVLASDFDQQTLALDSARRELANALAHTELDMEMLGAARDELKEARGALDRMSKIAQVICTNYAPTQAQLRELDSARMQADAALSPTKAGTGS